MPSQASDAIVVVEEWISEHYFTTDARTESFAARVRARRRSWDDEKEAGTPRTRLATARRQLLRRFAAPDAGLNDELFAILGYAGIGYASERHGPLRYVRSSGLDAPVIAVVEARPVDAVEELADKDAENLVVPFAVDEKPEITSVARLLSKLFVSDDRPEFALVLAGQRMLIAERERWPEGRYLTVDLQLVLERNDDRQGGELDRALVCLAADSLAPDAEGRIWWAATLDESVKHTVGVSKDLREGVRLSVEIVANEVVRRRQAQGLDPLPAAEAHPLAKQALRFLYRILFLLYAEASPELGVLPAGAPEYERGYSLDRLRDLTLVTLTTPGAEHGTHLYESLAVLFRMVDEGHDPGTDGEHAEPLTFRPLRADLFLPEATARIDEVGLGNGALQQVLRHLLLSKASRDRGMGFISYAELGINQLGAVYEGLMSYTGIFAESDLYEVAKDGNPEKGSWVVPVERSEGILDKDLVRAPDPITGEEKPVMHAKGTFVFRLAGRERQQSASYYTPEVLTRFVVSQALEELLDQSGRRTSAANILELTICEPALGSGAFAIEAVRQLAEQYLRRRQEELGESIEPDEYAAELQRVKASIALHQTYGVDLNATAVELAEISLWLDTMVAGLAAPWFGLHLRRGNSLIGARRAAFPRTSVADRSWLKTVPRDGIESGVAHFLLPAEGWGSAADVGKEIKELVPDAVRDLNNWRKGARAKLTKAQVDQLVDMGHRVRTLWEIVTRRLKVADSEIRRDIPLWGRDRDVSTVKHVTREEIEASLADPESAYGRLRRIMDAWCALWFWPLTETEVKPPTVDQWLGALAQTLGRHAHKGSRPGQEPLTAAVGWDALSAFEETDRTFAGATPMATVLAHHPWLAVCDRIAQRQGFFHWGLDFAPVFERGGFDLQVGNPPWVRPESDVEALLAEGDPWWQLATKQTQAEKSDRRPATLSLPGVRDLVIDGTADVIVTRETLGSPEHFPLVGGLRPNLYRCFMERTWSNQSDHGIVGLIHPESHFTDDKAGRLRAATYQRLRRHWQFINELRLFEIQDQKVYGVHVYGSVRAAPKFLNAISLYHPDTVERSFAHDGTGDEPGLKDPSGAWDLRPHRDRVLTVDRGVLQIWHDLTESEAVPPIESRMVYTVNRASAAVLAALVRQPRMARLGLEFSQGWNETTDRQRSIFDVKWGAVGSWQDVILQGPHLHLSLPFFKSPNATMLHNLDWSAIDLETLPPDAIPITSFKPTAVKTDYDRAYDQWTHGSARAHYRVAWRTMVDNVASRTLSSAIIPPGSAHVDGVFAAGFSVARALELVLVQATAASMLSDLVVRAVPKKHVRRTVFERLPTVSSDHQLKSSIVLRALRLNCLTEAYAELWHDALAEIQIDDIWAGGIDYSGRPQLGHVTPDWTPSSPLRRASDRRQALLEVDALIALALEIPIDDLCTIYHTQFPALRGFDRSRHLYDANGRLVPGVVLTEWRRKGDGISEEQRTDTNASGNTYVYELPFVTLDREADMRAAYAHFDQRG